MDENESLQSAEVEKVIGHAAQLAANGRHQFMTPEHLLYAICVDEVAFEMVVMDYGDIYSLELCLRKYIDDMEKVPGEATYTIKSSSQMDFIIEHCYKQSESSGGSIIGIPHVVDALLKLEDSFAAYQLRMRLCGREADFISHLITEYNNKRHVVYDDVNTDDLFGGEYSDDEVTTLTPKREPWRNFVTCLNDVAKEKNPLIGRERELERTIQVLCRMEKNNPLHVGEPGVGKTALVYGLTQRILDGDVPPRLLDSKVYMLDMGTLVAGTEFRGDFERRVKNIMDGVIKEGKNNIVYIDEIHTLVGAGAAGESSLDGSNLLKPYLESGDIRFIGSTTYEEYNKHFSRSKGLVRRFQQIDILEPSTDEAINILQQLKPRYEAFHDVEYEDAAISTAVLSSAKYIGDRFLPDKAIDIIDEAGAAVGMAAAKDPETERVVTKAVVDDILTKVCKVEAMAIRDDRDTARMATLEGRILSQVFGQDEAVRQVTEAVMMSKAGLTDDDKPMASLLFVGPTGVGKTEVARTLAKEMGVELLRFDMSEYTEKHAVAKLIGSPAGYIGYDDGGQLTDAVRRAPNSVLLLDEIEKAHPDIYNILLQVMDYARLTDNKGRHADFRNVIVIMTSNAGAEHASQASIGFTGGVERGEAMLRQVKKTFKPEFINRLSATVVFHDMDRQMAALILRKKLRQLEQKLSAKHVELKLTDEVFSKLLDEGFTKEYGAREMDRVIARRIKPMLVHEILFGSLRKGGSITIDKIKEN